MTSPNSNQLKALIDPETGQPLNGAQLGAVLSGHAELTPDRPAVTFGARTVSFAELDLLANRRARQLAELGVGQDDRVVVVLPNSLEFIECTFAVWKLGACACPISHRLTPAEFAAIVELAEPAAVLSDQERESSCPRQLIVEGPAPAELSGVPLPPRFTRPGRIMGSGGSTGRPKLIVDPYPSAWGMEKIGYRRPTRCTLHVASPFYHAGPFATVFYGLSQGSHVVGRARFDAEEWLEEIARHRVDYVYTVPTIMTRITKLDPSFTDSLDLSAIIYLLHMAAPCPPETKRWWIERIGPEKVLEVYGGAERIGLTVIDGVDWLAHPGSVGRASRGDEIVITDEAGNALPAGEIGEVNFRTQTGPGSTYSYIGADTRIRGELDSYGDMGWLDSDGFLFIADRRTDMVVVAGVNVYPAEVETVIDSLPGVLCSAVIGLPDPDLGNRLHAIVELEPGAEPPDEQTFLASLHEQLLGFKRPRSAEFTHERVRDDAGKMRRSSLREARLAGAD
ncbi:MAG: AMP-binding protein [Novosphingobium sp.]|nr:AMP-binding protein [Novosphingobium sp.]